METYNNIELFVYCATKADFERELASGNVSTSHIGIIAETAEFWSNGAYYPLVHLKNVVEVSPAEFTFRPSAGAKSIRDESAVIRRIKGNTSVWGQLADIMSTITNSGYVLTRNDGDLSFSITRVGSSATSFWCALNIPKATRINGHKYLIVAEIEASGIASSSDYVSVTYYDVKSPQVLRLRENGKSFYSVISEPLTSTTTWQYAFSALGGAKLTVHNLQLFDLTAIFGTGKEPTTIEQFKEYYPEGYYPYCAPVIQSMRATGIETIGSNAFNKDAVEGGILNTDGLITQNDLYSVARVEVIPNKRYVLTNVANGYFVRNMTYAFYDSQDRLISFGEFTNSFSQPIALTGSITVPLSAKYMRVVVHNDYVNTCCVNLEHTGTLDANSATYFKEYRDLPDIAKYFPDGMHGIGDVYDEINLDNAIQRIGVRPYEDGDSDNMYARTDGTTTVYVLEEPIVTPIVEPLQLYYKVADFGTEKMISTLPSSPFRADIVYAFNAVDRIRDNARNIEKLEDIVHPLLNEDLATKSFVIDTIPTEIATATQRIEILQDFVPSNLIANVLYDWGSTTKVSIAIPHLATDNSNYDNKWMVRLALLSSDNLTIPFEVFWKDGIAPSWNEWCVCEITFFKDITGERTFGEWKIYK